MKHRSIGLIIGLMTIALLGVMAMQYFFIRQSYIQKAQLFDESVKAALNSVASKAEKKEVMELAQAQQRKNKEKFEREQRKLQQHLYAQETIEKLRLRLFKMQQDYRQQEDQLLRKYPQALFIENVFFETYINNPRNNDLVTLDIQRTGLSGSIYQENLIELGATRKVPAVPAKDDSVRFLVVMDINPFTRNSFNDIITLPPKTDTKLEREIRQLEQQLKLLQANTLMDTIAILSGKNPQLIEDFAAELELYKRPLSQRINVTYIKSELEKELLSRDIRSTFNLEIKDANTTLYSFANFSDEQPTPENVYSTELFRADNDASSGRLAVYFPNKSTILMGNMTVMLFSSIALLFVLVGSFAYTIFTIFRQKKISEMKTDFINNMTHEFKTPVATIMIASESLKDPEIASDQSRATRLANIIYDENVRLGNHIERVLNIARLEKDNLKLEHRDVDINDLAQAVVDSMELQLQKHGASVRMNLNATNAMVVGDELHFSNVLFNLIDNAIKYSTDYPELTIRTRNSNKHIVITVTDKGIGMSRDQLTKIFDQFYRIPTGNRHDVKGFGLGLSYVHDIVKRSGGKVQVRSEKDKGTTFEIILPVKG